MQIFMKTSEIYANIFEKARNLWKHICKLQQYRQIYLKTLENYAYTFENVINYANIFENVINLCK